MSLCLEQCLCLCFECLCLCVEEEAAKVEGRWKEAERMVGRSEWSVKQRMVWY